MKTRTLMNVLLAMFLIVSVVAVSGCKSVAETTGEGVLAVNQGFSSVMGGHGLGESEKERTDDHSRQLRLNGSMLVDDIDAWMMTDRASRLSEFTVR
ncbi:MAG TPA: hypothetical protein DDX75_15035 [Phycisphaerales bacterium]|nr:hypothetical protein [Phycisphaerales bacterium]